MKLSIEQQIYIEDFINKEKIKYYEVFIEILDHMVLRVEEILENNPKIDFKTAVDKAKYENFYNGGFTAIEKEREAILNKHYNKDLLLQLKNYFKAPRIVLSTAIFAVCYVLTQFIEEKSRLPLLVLIFLAGFVLIDMLYNLYKYNKIEKFKVLKMNVFSYYSSITGFGYNLYVFFFNIFQVEVDFKILLHKLLFSIIATLTILTFLIYINLRNKTLQTIKQYQLV